ncbi:HEAT repeat domain-containing protein [Kitasatospora sp. NPDC058115]|uniref:HEAT repeat domain-containing protein n=1 Tax=Kitasatospora sp. NPDC058115 TaxID=3346347 RepID=UPI0036DCF9B3
MSLWSWKRKPSNLPHSRNEVSGSTVGGSVVMSNTVGELHIHHGSGPEPAPMDTEGAVQAYLQRVREVYRRLNLDVLGPTGRSGEQPLIELRHVFMPQLARAHEKRVPSEVRRLLVTSGELVEEHELPEPQRTEPARPVLQVLASEAGRRLVVLGDPGAGKSTLSKYLALALAGALEEVPAELAPLTGLVPVVVELRQYAQAAWRERTIEDFLDHLHRQERMCLPRTVLEELLAGGRALVVFDGLDEIFDPEVRSETARRITAFAAAHPGVRTIVTSREYGYRPGAFTTTGFAQVMLQNLERDQVETFVRRWYAAAHPEDLNEAERLTQRLLGAVRDIRAVAELSGNPLLLTILAAIGLGRAIPRERREVYAHAVEVLISRWDKDAKFLTPQSPSNAEAAQALEWLNTSRRLKLLERVARRMQNGTGKPGGTYVQRDELAGIISGYLTEHNISRPAADIAADHVVEHLSTRNFLLAHYGGGIYGFVHRTFLEYLAAADILRRREEEEWSREELVSLLDERAGDPAWHEVILLTAGKLKQRDVAALLGCLLERHRREERTSEAPLLVLAIRTLAEVEEIGTLSGRPNAKRLSVAAQSDAVIDALCVALSRRPVLNVEEALPALATFDHFWNGREQFLRWYFADQVLDSVRSESSSARIAATLGRDLTEVIRQTRLSWDLNLRPAALRRLAECWPDHPDTRTTIRNATTDPEWSIRYKALPVLAKHWPDHPDTHTTVRKATTDPESFVRVEALRTLAARWPDDRDTYTTVRDAVTDPDWFVRVEALRTLATRWPQHPDTHTAIHNAATPRSRIRGAALEILAEHWPDHPDTHTTIRNAAAPHSEIRGAALRILAQRRPDHPDTHTTIHNATTDPEWSTRYEVLSVLARHWPEHPATRTTVRNATTDPEWIVRRAALRTLAEHWPEHPDTRATLHDATTTPYSEIRGTALEILATRWPDHPDTHTAIHNAATPHSEVRGTALEILATRWPDHPDTLATLHNAAARRSKIRGTALRILARHWPEHPDTHATLRNATTDPDDRIRATALSLMAWRARDAAFPITRQAARADSSADVRVVAVKLLALLWPNEPGVPGLVGELAKDDNENVRLTAEQALALLK